MPKDRPTTTFSVLVLRRLCDEICRARAVQEVELPDVLRLDHPMELQGSPRGRRIVEAAREASGAWRVLFVHTDGSGDAEAARVERIEPAFKLLANELTGQGIGVAVVPVRETETWALADGDALREVFGLRSSDAELGIALRSHEIESISDPKRVLERVFEAARPTRRTRRTGVSPFLDLLGERVDIDLLRSLPSFVALEQGLLDGLRQLAIVDPPKTTD